MKYSIIAALLAALHVSSALAEPYAGLSIGTRSRQELLQATGPAIQPADRVSPLAFYGGYRLSDQWAVEAGYARMTDTSFATAGGVTTAESSVSYLAARRRWPISESLGWYGKLGVARNALRVEAQGATLETDHKLRPMGAVGIDYHLTAQIAAIAEISAYGKAETSRTKVRHSTLQTGVRFDF